MSQSTNHRLYITTLTANLFSFSVGTAYSWTSPVIPQLYDAANGNNPFSTPITTVDESWIVSLLNLGAAIGTFVATPIADRFGRKKALIYFSIPLIIAYVMMAFGNNVYYYLFARLLSGLSASCVFAVTPTYAAEISQSHNRGVLGSFMATVMSSGIVFCYLIGSYVSICVLSLLCMAPLLIFLVGFGLFCPETPYYLIKRDRKMAENVLKSIRPANCDVQKELLDIEMNIEQIGSKSDLKTILSRKSVRRGLIITIGLMFFQQFTGITPMLANMQSIFESTKTNISSDLSTMAVGVLQLTIVTFSGQLIDRLGRRILLIISTVGCALSLACLSSFFFLKTAAFDVSQFNWLPIASLMLYYISYNLGIGPIPWPVMGEVFANDVKSIANTLTAFSCLFLAFILTLFFPQLIVYLGLEIVFAFFAACCVIATIFIIILMPETKGKSFIEIQNILSKTKSAVKN